MRTAKTLIRLGGRSLRWAHSHFLGSVMSLVLSCRGSCTFGPKYPRTRTYKQYTHVYWVQEIHERISLKEYISSIYAVWKKNILFLLCPEKKIFWLSDCEKKKSLFFYRKKMLRKKKNSIEEIYSEAFPVMP